ncbi:E3 ubiquitin-protein ligase MIB2-like [Amphiura filiformis]|uniref:E3 ubiquitin-protein ligase MIB2-like n=1 Tax=Amphiura filiformis TaxID=82378 RepID=UPI003B223E92
MFYGARVVRGPDWEWGNQDGGPGYVGTVIVPETEHINDTDVVWIHWDNGVSANYRGGLGKECDLRIYDNAQLGVKHKGVRCDACMKWDIEGMRWRCAVCHDFDLCTNCYMSDNHDTSHVFLRIDVPGATPVKLPIRDGCNKIKAKGIFVGAKVMRGLKWRWGDQDGGKGSTGSVTYLDNWTDSNTFRTMVCVTWSNGHKNKYRLGLNGAVDVIYAKGNEGHGGFYYPEHLPRLDLEKTHSFITPGDQIRVKPLKLDVFKRMQEKRCGWKDDMAKVLGKVGKVVSVDKDGDVKTQFTEGPAWFLHPMCLLPEKKSDQGRTSAAELGQGSDDEAETSAQLLRLMLSEIAKGRAGSQASSPQSSPEMLTQASAKGDVSKVKQLIQSHPNWVDHRTDKGFTSLHLSSHEGHYEIVSVLLSANADKELTDKDGDAALAFSCFGNKPSVTKLLLKKGCNPNAVNRVGRSCLHIAAGKGFSACVSALLMRDEIDVNKQDNDDMTSLMRAIESGDSPTIDLIVDEPAVDFTIKNKRGFNPLQYAALKGNAHSTERIVSKCKPDFVESHKEDGWTALHVAIFNNHTEVATALIERGHANMNCRTSKKEAPLHLACAKGLNKSIELLVNGGAEVNAQDDDGDTPLHAMLMKQTVRDVMGQTPVGALLQSFQKEGVIGDLSARNIAAIAVYLIKNGANIYKQNQKGKTVLDCVGTQALKDLLKQSYDQYRGQMPPYSATIVARHLQEECKVQ